LFKVKREKVRLSVSPYTPPPEWDEELDAGAESGVPEPGGESAPEQEDDQIDDVESARERAGVIIAEAETEAARMLEDARAQAGEIRQKAYNEGFLEGHIEGDRKAAEEFESIAAENKTAVERVLSEFFAARETALNEFKGVKDEIRPLVFEIVKKIINLSYEKYDTFFEALIGGALEKLQPEGKLTLTVSESDYERFFPSGSAVFNVNGKDIPALIVKNASLGQTELIIDSDDATVNAGPDTQLRRVMSAFERLGAL
jgi:flagellar assembly protein FliH